MISPAAKKMKTEEGAVVTDAGAEAAAATEVVQEPEQDAPADKRAKLKETVKFNTEETTLNVMESTFGNMLMPLTEGGLQYLLAGVRANAGVKSGRYMFEVKLVQNANVPQESAAPGPMPKHALRVGVSTKGSSLLLSDPADETSAFVDIDGCFMHNKKRVKSFERFGQNDVMALVVNLNEEGVNAQTLSVYKNGAPVGKPVPLPDALKGKTLYPTITFRNTTVLYNFGAEPLAPLPFKCRMWQDAAAADVDVTAAAPAPKDGKYEVIFPVALPAGGGFDWLQDFLERNPQYTELSAGAIVRWAEKSGVARKGFGSEGRGSKDAPELASGLPSLEDGSVMQALLNTLPLQKRNIVVMDLRTNLVKADRKENLANYPSHTFKRVAAVAMGEPKEAIKKAAKEAALAEKQKALDLKFAKDKAEWLRKKQAKEKLKEIAQKKKALQKAAAEARKKKEAEAKQKEEEAKKKEEEAKKEAAGEEGEEKKEEEVKDEMETEVKAEEPEKAEEAEAEEEEAEDEDMEPEPTEPEKAELTAEEEKSMWFKTGPLPDLVQSVVDKQFVNFSIPDKAEGFDEIRYEWANQAKSAAVVKEFITSRKLTARLEDLQPSAAFQAKIAAWQKAVREWQAKGNAYKTSVKEKAALKLARAAQKEQAKKAREMRKMVREKIAAKKAEEAAKKAEEAAAKGEEPPAEEKPEEKEPEEEEDEPMEEEEEKEEELMDFDELDVFGVEDVLNIGDGRPLFVDFGLEDWTMMTLRAEMHVLVHAFRQDVKDAERNIIHLDNIGYYYQKYFKKPLPMQNFGCDSIAKVVDMIPDTVRLTDKNTLEALVPDLEAFNIFAMITEEARRERVRRLDMGDESARLKLGQSSGLLAGLAGARPVLSAPGAVKPNVLRPNMPVRPGIVGGANAPRPVAANAWGGMGAAAQGWRPSVVRPGMGGMGGMGMGGMGMGGMGMGGMGMRPNMMQSWW